jgi:hypothetical protein
LIYRRSQLGDIGVFVLGGRLVGFSVRRHLVRRGDCLGERAQGVWGEEAYATGPLIYRRTILVPWGAISSRAGKKPCKEAVWRILWGRRVRSYHARAQMVGEWMHWISISWTKNVRKDEIAGLCAGGDRIVLNYLQNREFAWAPLTTGWVKY